jgi:hypothetical protein
MVPWQYLRIRPYKAGGIHLANCKATQTCKGLKRPAARLTGTVRQAFSRPFISLEKKGVSDDWRANQIFMQKSNRKLMIFIKIIAMISLNKLFIGI